MAPRWIPHLSLATALICTLCWAPVAHSGGGKNRAARLRQGIVKFHKGHRLKGLSHRPLNRIKVKTPGKRWLTAGGVIVDPGNGKVLLVKIGKEHRKGRSGWTWPKGRVDPGEKLVKTAVREAREETGVTARPLLSLGKLKSSNAQRHYFLMTRDLGVKQGRPDHEAVAIKWVSVKKASKMLDRGRDRQVLSSARQALKALRRLGKQ
jgi:8-oxo-dGTP pyrophosphatase MutT (NUDIX family)